MDDYQLIKLLHIIGFAYWLGADLGVFYTSYFVADRNRPAAARIATAKILFALDLAPRICMTMMLPLGTHLAWDLGRLPLSATTMAIIWALCFAWLAMVLILHFAGQRKVRALLTTFDFYFRLILSLGLIAVGLYMLFGPARITDWIAAKIAIFGALVGCGLIVRIKLRPFAPAFAKLAGGDVSDADNMAIKRSLGGTKPFVVAIWVGLVISTALPLHIF